ncbi:MAG: hormogonium polysaccharide secretion pseudopilin HpsB [Cuspidothrix sp.]
MMQFTQQQKHNMSKDAGFTIVESLVAIFVASTLILAIAPVLVLSTATRVQSKRVELSAQAAKSFIDAVRSGRVATQSSDSIPTPYITTVGSISKTPSRSIKSDTNDYLISSTNLTTPTSPALLYCVQSDGIILTPDCSSNPNQKNLFYIQAGRIIVENPGPNDGYRLAVRVYRQDVDFTKTVLANTTTIDNTQSVVTSGLGNRQAPILEMTADISNSNTSFTALCNRLGFIAGSTGKTC